MAWKLDTSKYTLGDAQRILATESVGEPKPTLDATVATENVSSTTIAPEYEMPENLRKETGGIKSDNREDAAIPDITPSPEIIDSTPYTSRWRNFYDNTRNRINKGIIGLLIVAAGLGFFGGYFSHGCVNPVSRNKTEQILSDTSKNSNVPMIPKEPVLTPYTATKIVTRVVEKSYVVEQGQTISELVHKYEKLGRSALAHRVKEISQYNKDKNPEQKTAGIDNRSVIDGKVSHLPDGIPFDVVKAGSKAIFPESRTDTVKVEIYKDEQGNLYTKDKKPMTKRDLEKKLYDTSKSGDTTNTPAVRMRGTSSIQSGIQLRLFTAQEANDMPYINPEIWKDDFSGNYSYSALTASPNKPKLLSSLKFIYETNRVNDTIKILGMKKWQLYQILDKEFDGYRKGYRVSKPNLELKVA